MVSLPAILRWWMVDEGAANGFGLQISCSGGTGQVTALFLCLITTQLHIVFFYFLDLGQAFFSFSIPLLSIFYLWSAFSFPLSFPSLLCLFHGVQVFFLLLSFKFASGSLKNNLQFTLCMLICIRWRKKPEVISLMTSRTLSFLQTQTLSEGWCIVSAYLTCDRFSQIKLGKLLATVSRQLKHMTQ